MKYIALRGCVSGRVQGVSFRAFVAGQAQQHNLTGWVRNLPDGRVEVLLCGEDAAVRAVATALHRGPPLASVTEVALTETTPGDEMGFTIR